jgi:hypothetical protein
MLNSSCMTILLSDPIRLDALSDVLLKGIYIV